MHAFYDLTASRQVTMGGEGPIPVSEILAYCELDGIVDPDERVGFMRTIRAMDAAYLSERRKAAEQEREAGKGTSKPE